MPRFHVILSIDLRIGSGINCTVLNVARPAVSYNRIFACKLRPQMGHMIRTPGTDSLQTIDVRVDIRFISVYHSGTPLLAEDSTTHTHNLQFPGPWTSHWQAVSPQLFGDAQISIRS